MTNSNDSVDGRVVGSNTVSGSIVSGSTVSSSIVSGRRQILMAGLGVAALGCQPAQEGPTLLERLGGRAERNLGGGFVGPDHERGHLLRPSEQRPLQSGTARRHTRVAIVGAGVAGLAAARALHAAGIDDYQLFELDAAAGGNSRAGAMAGLLCPWGAHYLPTPDLNASGHFDLALIAMLREFGLIQKSSSGERYLEQALCHAPQERVLVDGRWQSGVLPLEDITTATRAQYQRFADEIRRYQLSRSFSIPAAKIEPSGSAAFMALDRISFAQWLQEQHFDDARLRWYLDYCCRDDYGADSSEVSAWAGIHYFASRHGFAIPADGVSSPTAESSTEVLTWPQGNAWLIERMAATLGPRLRLNALVTNIEYQPRPARAGSVNLSVRLPLEQRSEHWSADFVVLAIPFNVAAQILQPVPAALRALLPSLKYSAWQVANVHLSEMPVELPGSPRSWDNVIYGREWLGFVDASHQMLQSHQLQTVWTSYRALGSSAIARRKLLTQTWREHTQQVLADLRVAYPRIERVVSAIDVTRWGHAMIVPVPGLRSNAAFQAIRNFDARVHFAHSDVAGYSIFEEAFANGYSVGADIARQLST
jgi:monoamine oxidase